MEQAPQQINQKPPLPTKTKIAAWWMIIIGIILFAWSIYILGMVLWFRGIDILAILALISSLILCLLGFNILKTKKWAWWVAIILLPLVLIVLTPYFGFILLAILFSAIITLGPIDCFLKNQYIHQMGLGPCREGFFIALSPFLIVIIPLCLLFLDRKNFFKIAS